jgi:hypothetical protein
MKSILSLRMAMATILLASAALLPACSRRDGPTRHTLSGKATFDGQPIPFGRILLQPDGEAGNSGPAGVAEISNGSYRTRADAGHIGGPHILTVTATDGTRPSSDDIDNSLFPPFQIKVTLPAENGKHDLDVPPVPVRKPGRR